MKALKKILVGGALLGALSLPISGFAQPQDRDQNNRPTAQKDRDRNEQHPVIEDSIRKLQEVRDELEHKAASDFKGHKQAAIKSIDEAIAHLHQALRADK